MNLQISAIIFPLTTDSNIICRGIGMQAVCSWRCWSIKKLHHQVLRIMNQGRGITACVWLFMHLEKELLRYFSFRLFKQELRLPTFITSQHLAFWVCILWHVVYDFLHTSWHHLLIQIKSRVLVCGCIFFSLPLWKDLNLFFFQLGEFFAS